ncbi:siderophore-interacting protein [Agrobacterium rhizogenes]|jgi:NADPH-dependent ferric siderophore reductase|uniref:siderophore-interacting protein n=1 Tax=Rhizobium rhizogenes TaxID=359 RepID=UPI0004D4F2E6|nr:siderophore-interacting protein [Rhizobium rhizogenes]KAA6476718.1 siderophore-interacting protein [Agrobacterium sp. ICMP 7243]OCJ04910.1 NADPH-dependent ferric siderophore reductase [Agrobacterium sp. 13-626]OCJ23801.1 NADPH-dependent ferric siderophore reductase [Agrobacterium sp. B133/95]KEA03139.1 FAD-binding protein [Rhizobium rhizogenes]MDJ1635408.1 siderophore-interacting protein [Rhizobium rhizogenes]
MSDTQTPTPVSTAPKIERVRHELKRRLLTVAQVDSITPGMLRIQFGGDDLSDFVSMAPDDHIKIFVPTMDGTEERRDYTPRRYDAAARMLAIDFAVHEAGPITQWAINARPGDTLAIGGPRGSAVISDIKQWLLIGDETALPAIGRRIEAAGGEARITAVMAVANPAEHQTFKTNAELICHWAHRPLSEATDASALLSVLRSVDIAPETFVWVAAEASVTRAIRVHLVEERGYPLSWIKASGYWVKGKADATEKFE